MLNDNEFDEIKKVKSDNMMLGKKKTSKAGVDWSADNIRYRHIANASPAHIIKTILFDKFGEDLSWLSTSILNFSVKVDVS